MSVLSALASWHTDLSDGAIDHLHALLGEWQLLSDLAFADCLLFAPTRDGDSYIILGQVRPYPAQTLYVEDMVGSIVDGQSRLRIGVALNERRIVREGDPEWRDGTPVREEAIPVIWKGEPIAAIISETNLATARTPSRLELAYLRAAGDLAQMIAEGSFPTGSVEPERELMPRVGDGFIRVGADWTITYASPNALSAYRRLGVTTNLIGERFGTVGDDDRDARLRLERDLLYTDEIEAGGAWVLRRFIPLTYENAFHGAIGLVRDITELRRRDRMLLIKDATIREIHHRVKNNLQTVASLLRLQARRLGPGPAGDELEESVRRITSIALVHETLSQEASDRVEFDEVAGKIVQMVTDSLVDPSKPVNVAIEGSSGTLHGDIATPLSLILTELIQNTVEHAFVDRGGDVVVRFERKGPALAVHVIDDGAGLPEGFTLETGSNLGLQIVRTLATELHAEVSLDSENGTRATLTIPNVRG